MEWLIHPQRGWGIESIVFFDGDGLMALETRVALKQFGPHWYPESVEYWSHGELASVVRTTSATFDREEHPANLTYNDLGAEPGMRIAAPGRALALDPVWDGQRAIPRHEWDELVRRGQRENGPTVQRALANETRGGDLPVDLLRRAYSLTGVLEGPLSLWRLYTDRLIWAYALDKEQTQRALLILHECEELGRKQHAARGERFAALHQRVLEAQRSELTGERADSTWATLDRDVRGEIEFLTKIFHDQLLPRLHRIATRSQRDRAARENRIPLAFP